MTEYRVRYKGAEQSLKVRMVYTWNRSDMADGMDMSNSGGPKPTINNMVHALFVDPDVDAVYWVRAGGPPFFLIRKAKVYFDVSKAEVEVKLVKAEPAPNIRPADKLIA